jgi:uncharacterized damage-inducible protein DinB
MFDIDRVRASWRREAEAIDRIVDQLDEAAAKATLREDGWSAQDLVGHIASAARGFVAYIDGRQGGAIDVDAFNHEQRERNRGRPWSDVQGYWRRARDEVGALLERVDASIAERPVQMPWLPEIKNGGQALRAMIIHTRGHREELSHADRLAS